MVKLRNWLIEKVGIFFKYPSLFRASLAGAFILFLKSVYLLLQEYAPQGTTLTTFLDQAIPFTSFFALFYVLYYPFIVLPLILNAKNKNILYMTLGTMLLVSFCSFVTYGIFQTEIARPEVIIRNIFDKIVNLIYTHDKPLNLFPSLHVSLTTVAFLSLRKINKKLSNYLFPVALGIIISTVFIKQHYVADVIAGLILASFSYILIFQWNSFRKAVEMPVKMIQAMV